MKNLSNLTPTHVMRSDGHMTTVHKKTDAPAPSSKLAMVAPPKPANERSKRMCMGDAKAVKVKWQVRGGGVDQISFRYPSLLFSLGYEQSDYSNAGESVMTQGQAYEFLRMGVTLPEASFLLRFKSPREWFEDEELLGSIHPVMTQKRSGSYEAIQYLRENDVPVKTAQKMLANGFCDEHLGGKLNCEQLRRLFTRFDYKVSKTGGRETTASAVIKALVDGVLPFKAFEYGYDRRCLGLAVSELRPYGGRTEPTFTDEERSNVQSNTMLILDALSVLSSNSKQTNFGDACRATLAFGKDAAIEHGSSRLLIPRRDGSYLGTDGINKVESLLAFCAANPSEKVNRIKYYDLDRISLRDESGLRRLSLADVVYMLDAGVGHEELVDACFFKSLTPDQTVALHRGDTQSAIVEGWL